MRECDVILDIDIELLHGHRESEDPREDGEISIANRNRKIAYPCALQKMACPAALDE